MKKILTPKQEKRYLRNIEIQNEFAKMEGSVTAIIHILATKYDLTIMQIRNILK